MGLPLETLPDWPAGMNRDAALAYTGVAREQLREWEKRGAVTFRPRGPRGELITRRADLDRALADMFAGPVEDDGGPIEL